MAEHEGEHGGEHGRRHYRLFADLGEDVCEKCGSNDHVHDRLCRRCREALRGEGELLAAEHQEEPHQAYPAPLHNPPWRRRGA